MDIITFINFKINGGFGYIYEGCPESIQPFWISCELVAWPWCSLAASQRIPYCASVNSHSPVGLVSRQWDAVDWACVLCDRRIHKLQAHTCEGCPESIQPFWISREPVAWPWCNLAASQMSPYCASVNSHSPVGLVSRQWDAVEWTCVPPIGVMIPETV